MDRKPDRISAVTTLVVIFVAAVGLYFGAYFWMVEPVRYFHSALLTMGAAHWKPWADATYPMAPGPPKFWETVFAPANAIDRKLRPGMWSAEE